MRKIVILCLLAPLFAGAQLNRSAKEYASEIIEDYVQQKLFKNQPYKPVSFGELKPVDDLKKVISWSMVHSFEIIEMRYEGDRKISKPKSYKFSFYLDEKMNVKRAETYFLANE